MDSKFNSAVSALAEYGVSKGLVEKEDRIYVINRLLEVFGEDEYEQPEQMWEASLTEILDTLTDLAFERGVIQSDDIVTRDLFDTKLMGCLTPPPSEVNRMFWDRYKKSAKEATDFFYGFSQDNNYIRRDRIEKDRRWKVSSDYGEIDITINLSKPEKDPKAIAAALNAKQSAYPKCQLCVENEGYAGRMNHPARQNHRIIPIRLAGDDWGFQYSPYVYYNEHCIVLNREHTPMKISRKTFERLFSFVEQFPHYFLGSNADLPIVGGSILTHDHFQGGNYSFAMAKAPFEKMFTVPGYEDVKTGIVHWPMSVIRIAGKDPQRLIDLADHILSVWRQYTDEEAFIFANTDGTAHNTITPIARIRNGQFELDLVLRDNITTKEFPLGVFHPHPQLHHIKKENIGLIEVMGLAVLPSRLKVEMDRLEECLREGGDPYADPDLEKHAPWADEIRQKYPNLKQMDIAAVLREEIGLVFVQVLEDSGVYKCTPEGRRAFDRFLAAL